MKSIVITGSTKGIGFGLAQELALRGHNVLISGRGDDAVREAVTRIERAGVKGKVIGKAADVSQRQAHEALWDAAVAAFGRVDIWINNAGFASATHDIVDLPSETATQMITTNMNGTIFGSQVAAQRMLKQGGGQIFNMLGGGSDGTIRKGMGVYGATKRGLDYFTRALTKELEGTNVLVGRIRPGIVVTEGMIREAREDTKYFEKNRKVLNILCDEPEVVARYLVDHILAVDKNGASINWLSTARVTRKFLLAGFQKRDLFSSHGL